MEIQQKATSTLKNIGGILIAVFLALLIRSFLFEPYNIPSSSMVPTLLVGDYLFISKYPYGYSKHSFPYSPPIMPQNRLFGENPKRGDVVIFKEPTHNKTDYIKRVIGLPGDTIEMKNGRLYINDTLVERTFKGEEDWPTEHGLMHYTRYEETLPNGVKHDIYELSDNANYDNVGPFKVLPNHFFMMGDNRDNSLDSRYFGSVPFENLQGRAEFIFYSTNGTGYFFQFWKWPSMLRFKRFFTGIE